MNNIKWNKFPDKIPEDGSQSVTIIQLHDSSRERLVLLKRTCIMGWNLHDGWFFCGDQTPWDGDEASNDAAFHVLYWYPIPEITPEIVKKYPDLTDYLPKE